MQQLVELARDPQDLNLLIKKTLQGDKLNPVFKEHKEAPVRQTLVTCLIQQERYQDALQYMDQDVSFEHAYCLYRLNRLEEALTVLQSTLKEDLVLARLHLTAQILYRLERFQEAIDLYDSIESNVLDLI